MAFALPLWVVAVSVVLASCADWPDDYDIIDWSDESGVDGTVPGAEEDFPTLGSVPEPPENVSTLEDIEQALTSDLENSQYTSGNYQRADEEVEFELVPEPPPEVVEGDVDVEEEDDIFEFLDFGVDEEHGEVEEVQTVAVAEEVEVNEITIVAETAAGDEVVVDEVMVEETVIEEVVKPSVPATASSVDVVEVVEREATVAPAGAGGVQETFDTLFTESGPDAVSSGSDAATVTANFSDTPSPSITANGFETLVAIIRFNLGSTALDNNDRRILQHLADIHSERGGMIRLVGFASHDPGNKNATDETLVNFKISVDRATAVADELARQGVSSRDIIVDAQGDQSFLHLARGQVDEAQQRRVEIYFTN